MTMQSDGNNCTIDGAGTKEVNIAYNHANKLSGWYKELRFDNFRIGFGRNIQKQQTELDFDFNEETVEMHFTLKGSSTTNAKYVDSFSINENSHNIFYCNGLKGDITWPSSDLLIFEVNVKPSFFEQYLPNENIFLTFRKQMQAKEVGMMNNFNYPITPQMHFVIQQIMNCQLKNAYRKLFVEGKVFELLMLQIEQMHSSAYTRELQVNERGIQDKMYFAKELIQKNIKSPLTLSELSFALNTNECFLKKHFKATFGTTVFGYVQELKMNSAKHLLMNQQLNVSEVAERIGYKNSQHFSTAFKRYFGVSPSALR